MQLAIEKAVGLSAERQEALAALMLEEIESEARCESQFAASSEQLAAMAAKAIAEDLRGGTRPL